MVKEKQIEEMAKDLCQARFCSLEEWNECKGTGAEYCYKAMQVAKTLYRYGYRKQSEKENNMSCNQICPYNTLKGCNVAEKNGICPISQAGELFKKTEQLPPLIKTGELLGRGKDLYEVVIADDNIFVVCPLEYSKKERCVILKYSHPEIYANQCEINTLSDLGFWGVK